LTDSNEIDLQSSLQELDFRIRSLEQLPYPEARDGFFAVLQLVDQVHRQGMQNLAQRLKDADLWESCLEDEAVSVVMNLYDLVELSETDQAEQALNMVRPYIESHGGKVEMTHVEEGTVHIRLTGACESCSASAETLKHGVEAALKEGFSGFKEMVVEEVKTEESLLPIIDLQLNAPVFSDILPLEELPEGEPKVVDADGIPVLLVRRDGEVYCFEPTCAACGGPLKDCMISGNILMCGRYNCSFDIRSGRRVDGGEPSTLRVFPVTVKNGRIVLAVNVAPTAILQQ